MSSLKGVLITVIIPPVHNGHGMIPSKCNFNVKTQPLSLISMGPLHRHVGGADAEGTSRKTLGFPRKEGETASTCLYTMQHYPATPEHQVRHEERSLICATMTFYYNYSSVSQCKLVSSKVWNSVSPPLNLDNSDCWKSHTSFSWTWRPCPSWKMATIGR